MTSKQQVLFTLPDEKEIETIAEHLHPWNPCLVRREIRYRNGIVVVIFQDFSGKIFHVGLHPEDCPFWMSKNQILTRRNSE